MATFISNRYSLSPYKPFTGEKGVAWGKVDIATALSIGDVLKFFRMPKNTIALGGRLIYTCFDDAATPTLDIDFGTPDIPKQLLEVIGLDKGNITNFLLGSSVGVMGTRDFNGWPLGIPEYDDETDVQGVVTGNPTTQINGYLFLRVDYTSFV